MLLTRKSSRSSTPEPFPNGINPLHTLNPRTQGMESTATTTILTITAFFRLHPVKSMAKDKMFSKTAITVDTAAKIINKKNKAPQILPPAMELNTFGSVIKIRLGPSPGSTPYAKHDGKMIRPAIKATKVSRSVTRTASPVRLRDLSI